MTYDCGLTTYYAVEVTGADSDPIPSGASAMVSIGGTAYQVWVAAVSTIVPVACGEEPPQPLPIRLTFEAKNLAQLAASLSPI